MAKTVRVSDDAGVTWHSLPGSSADKNMDSASAQDTIFGQSFNSTQPTLIDLTVTANSVFKGFAGYKAKILKNGSSTAFTTLPMTLVSGKRYRINDATKSLWNRAVAVTVYDNAVDHTADVVSVNWLFGEVVFASGYTVTGPVTVTGEYFPQSELGAANSLTLTQTAEAIDTTTFGVAQANSGHVTRDPGLRTVNLSLNGIYSSSAGLIALLTGRTEVMIEVNPDGNSKSRARGFFKCNSHVQSGDVGALEDEQVGFELSVPDDAEFPFQWQHANDTTLHAGVKAILDAWANEEKIDVQYLYDGTNGVEFSAVVTDASMETSLTGMNTFNFTFAADGATTAVP